jgi:predicted nuclease of restriction endonuclease-like (RecB) superfamily
MNNNLPIDYQSTLLELKNRINKARYKSIVAVNSELILMYLDIGKVVSEKVKSGWGDSVIDNLSKDLQAEYVGLKGFSPRSIRRMKLIFEQICNNEIWTQLVTKLPWSHTNLIFAKIKDPEQRTFYLQRAIDKGWSRGVLEEEIKFDAYSKHINFQSNFPKTIDENSLVNYRLEFKDEYDLSFLGLEETHSERDLENALVDNILKTLGKLGSDFAFMGRQFRLELDEKEYFIDLLFYHRRLKCMVAIELKTSEFKPEHSQQLNWYLHLLDKTVKYEDDKPSIGILLCKNKSKITVEYALELVHHPMGISTYSYSQLPKEIAQYLPTEDDLSRILSDEKDILD